MTFTLRLYVLGDSGSSRRAITNANRIVARFLDGSCRLAVLDVREHTDEAERENIVATPTLLVAGRQPARRVVGDLSDMKQVAEYLALPDPPGGWPGGTS